MVKVKSKTSGLERGNAKIVILPIDIGMSINTLEYFEDYNLKSDAACPTILSRIMLRGAFSDGRRLAKRTTLDGN